MKPGIRYIVVSGSTPYVFEEGDPVRIDKEKNVYNYKTRWWSRNENYKSAVFKMDCAYYQNRKLQIEKQLAKINIIINECKKEEK